MGELGYAIGDDAITDLGYLLERCASASRVLASAILAGGVCERDLSRTAELIASGLDRCVAIIDSVQPSSSD